MTTTLESEPATTPAEETSLLIDTDVHAEWKSMNDILPYLDEFWQSQIERWHFPAFKLPGFPYLPPLENDGTRKEWRDDHPTKGYPGNDLGTLQRQLLDEDGVSIAILDGISSLCWSTVQTQPELLTALASAYNDWQIDKWLSADSRLRGSVGVYIHDPEKAAAEIDRIGSHPQIVQVCLPTLTDVQYGDPRYRPIYEAALRNDLVVALHHTSSTRAILGYPRYFTEWHTTAAPVANIGQLASLIFNGTFDEYPDLKVVVLEAGVAWLPWFMWRADEQYRAHRSETPWVKKTPSEHIRDNIRIATMPLADINARQFEAIVELSDAERVFVFSSDYPHFDADSAHAVLPTTLSKDLLRRVRWQNALETFPKLRDLAPTG